MKFRHLTNWQRESFSLNKEYYTDWYESNYWSQKQNNENILRENSNQSIEVLKGIEGILKIMGADLDISILFEGLQKAKYYSELLKEYIFEYIRLKEFPEILSRKNCMFLIPNEVNIEEYLKNMNFDLDNKTLIEIEIDDSSFIHLADIRLLNCNNLTHNEKVALAKEYWSGTKNRDINTEILYTGKFEISKILELGL